jgi:hypothetical protein
MPIVENGLVGKRAMLEILFPNEADRPCERWLDHQCKRKALPFCRLGRLIFFNPPEVLAAIATRHTIRSRR